MNYVPEYEKYNGGRGRITCPSCGGRKQFSAYVNERGERYADHVGTCNRSLSCGYHYPPKQYFLDNPHLQEDNSKSYRSDLARTRKTYSYAKAKVVSPEPPKKPDFIDRQYALESLTDYENNSFVNFLLNLFSDRPEAVAQAVEKYFIGTFERWTVFWQIDRRGRIRTGEMLKFDTTTGKRQTVSFTGRDGNLVEIDKNWIHARLKKLRKISENFNLELCSFGEHLIKDASQTVAIVEAAKTAVICSIVFPEFTWIAAGALGYLTTEKLLRYKGNKIILFPDGKDEAFELWRNKAAEAKKQGVDVSLSTLIKQFGTEEEKAKDFDLADYLIAAQRDRLLTPKEKITPKKCKPSILDPLEAAFWANSAELEMSYRRLYLSGVWLNFDANKIQAESVAPMDEETLNFISRNRHKLLRLAQYSALKDQWFNSDPLAAETYRLECRERAARILYEEKISGSQAMERATYEVTKDWYVLHQQLKQRPIIKDGH